MIPFSSLQVGLRQPRREVDPRRQHGGIATITSRASTTSRSEVHDHAAAGLLDATHRRLQHDLRRRAASPPAAAIRCEPPTKRLSWAPSGVAISSAKSPLFFSLPAVAV